MKEKIKIEQLEYFGIPNYIINIWKEHYSDTLLPVQENAVRQFGLLGDSNIRQSENQKLNTTRPLLVISPTSSGKTLVAEMAAIKEISLHKRVIFLVPLRILAEEKYRHFLHLYHLIGLKVKLSSSDHRSDDKDIINGDFHIAVIVYEKFYYLQLQYSQFLNNVSLIIADEIQLINDYQRGPCLENSFNYLRIKHPDIRIIALSSFTENSIQLIKWLDAKVLFSVYRPIELRKGIVRNGIFKYIEHNTRITGKEIFFPEDYVSECNLASYLKATLDYLVKNKESNLVFFPTKKEVRMWSSWLASQFNLPCAQIAINELNALEDSTSREELISLLQNGIAYHCASLSKQERNIIEKAVRCGDIKIICATETLSMGVNLPVNNVILTGQRIISEKNNKNLSTTYYKRPLTLSEVENMGGRAGRLNKQKNFGRIIFLAPSLIELTAYQNLYFEKSAQNGAIIPISQQAYPALQTLQSQTFQARENSFYDDNNNNGNLATLSVSAQTSVGIFQERPVKIEHDFLTFLLQKITQGYHSIDEINSFHRQEKDTTDNIFWFHKPYKKISRIKLINLLKQLENEKLIYHYNDGYHVTEMGLLIVSRGISFDSFAHFKKWLSESKHPIGELEVLFLIATCNNAREFTIPSPLNRFRKNKKLLTSRWKEYLRMRMLNLIFELGEDDKSIFKINLDKYKNSEINTNKKVDYNKYLAIKKTLLMFDWINGRELREIEEGYGILCGDIQKIGEGFSWLSDTLSAIANKFGWREKRIDDLQKIEQISERLATGIEANGLELSRLQIPDLTRSYIQRLVQEGYNNKQCLQELNEEQLASILPKCLVIKIKKHLSLSENKQGNSGKFANTTFDFNNRNTKPLQIDFQKQDNIKSEGKIKICKLTLIIDKNRPDRFVFLNKIIPITKINYQLILLLTENQGKMVSYDEIINTLWPDDEDATYHRLWYHLGKLRNNMKKIIQKKNLSDSPDNYIKKNILKVFPGRGLLLENKTGTIIKEK